MNDQDAELDVFRNVKQSLDYSIGAGERTRADACAYSTTSRLEAKKNV